MNFIRRVALSLKGRFIKNILLLILIVFLFTISLGSFVVYSATQNLENSIKLGLGAKATIITDFDRDKAHVSDYQPDLETLNVYTSLIQLFDDLGKLDYVSDMDYRLSNFTPDSYRGRLQSPDFVCTDDGRSICNTTIVKGYLLKTF